MPVFSCIRSLYIDWRIMVVVGGNILHHVKSEGELSGRGKCRGEDMSEVECPGRNVLQSIGDVVTKDCHATKRYVACWTAPLQMRLSDITFNTRYRKVVIANKRNRIYVQNSL